VGEDLSLEARTGVDDAGTPGLDTHVDPVPYVAEAGVE
jgi:hypothetical protein